MNSLKNDIVINLTRYLSYKDTFILSSVNKTYRMIVSTCPICIRRKILLQKKIVDSCFYHIRNKVEISGYSKIINVETHYTELRGDLLKWVDLHIYYILESAQKRVEDYNKELDSITHLNHIYKCMT
jgi:hypothetical protein